MIYLADIMCGVTSILAKSEILERWGGMRNAASPSRSSGGLPWAFVVLLIVLAVVLVVIPMLMYFRRRFVTLLDVLRATMMSPSAWKKGNSSISATDIDLLSQMVRKSGFIKPEMEFTLQHAFNVGMANYLGSDDFSELSADQRRDIAERIETLEVKIDAGRQERSDKTMTTREIPVGAQILVSCGDATQDDFETVVQANTEKGLKMQSPIPGKPSANSSWIFRYFDGVMVWGFTAPVVEVDGMSLWFQHTHELEMVNYRRFKRVAVDCTANICLFTFRTSPEKECSMKFVQARVVEIGGPGVMLLTPLQARVGERILIQMHLGKQEVIQSIGKIRRRNDADSRPNWNSYGVELVGLKPSQIAELIQATNNAAIQLHKEEQKEKEAALEKAMQDRQAVVTA